MHQPAGTALPVVGPQQALLQAAKERQQADESQMESDYLALKPLEQAVLWRLLEMGQRFRPYDAEELRFLP